MTAELVPTTAPTTMESIEYYRNAAKQAFEHALRTAEEAHHAANAAKQAAQEYADADEQLEAALQFYGEE